MESPTGRTLDYGIFRVVGDGIEVIDQIRWTKDNRILGEICVTASGFVGPHRDGAAIYGRDGTLEQTFQVAPTKHWGPRAAASPSGEWVIFTAPDGAIGIINTLANETSVVKIVFEQVLKLDVTNRGVCYVGGCGPDFWGLYRLEPDGRLVRLSEDHRASVAPTEDVLTEVTSGSVAVRAISEAPKEQVVLKSELLSLLPMARHGEAKFVSDNYIVVQTDTHHLAGVNLAQLSVAV